MGARRASSAEQAGIPSAFCGPPQPHDAAGDAADDANMVQTPPSWLSFYADALPDSKPLVTKEGLLAATRRQPHVWSKSGRTAQQHGNDGRRCTLTPEDLAGPKSSARLSNHTPGVAWCNCWTAGPSSVEEQLRVAKEQNLDERKWTGEGGCEAITDRASCCQYRDARSLMETSACVPGDFDAGVVCHAASFVRNSGMEHQQRPCRTAHQKRSTFGKARGKWERCELPVQEPTTPSGIVAVVCGGVLDLYFYAKKEHQTPPASDSKKPRNNGVPGKPASVLILELDSVSPAHAERHLKQTLALLRGNKTTAPLAGWDTLTYSAASVVGSNSIPNQLSLLRGCHELNDQRNPFQKGEDVFVPEHRGLKAGMHPPRLRRTMMCEPGKNGNQDEASWLFDDVRAKGGVTIFGEEFCSRGSTWVLQDHYFQLDDAFDYSMIDLYCAIAAYNRLIGTHALQGLPLNAMLGEPQQGVGEGDFGPYAGGENAMCLGNQCPYTWPMWFVRNVWHQIPHRPKFAYMNMMAAHSQQPNPVALEFFDGILADFLAEFLSSAAFKDTVILLRSDHGIQNGPHALNWAGQVEQKMAWTNLLVPRALAPAIGASAGGRVARGNQRRLVTAYDLHKTLKGIIDPTRRSSHGPSWAHDLLLSPVPAGRTCYSARVPYAYCLRQDEAAPPGAPTASNGTARGTGLDFSYEPRFSVCREDQDHGTYKDHGGCPYNWRRPMLPSVPSHAASNAYHSKLILHDLRLMRAPEALAARFDAERGVDQAPPLLFRDHTYVTLPCNPLPCNPLPYSLLPCNRRPFTFLPCSVLRSKRLPCNLLPCHLLPCNPLPCNRLPCNPR